MILNLNEYVMFKPTTLGWELLTKAEERIKNIEPRPAHMSKKTPYFYNEKENGKVTMLLWKMIEVFGKDMSLEMKPFSEDNKIEKAS